MSIDTPILFLTYKRINTARRVFDVIKKIKPKKLYFASNAPQEMSYEKDLIMVNKVRDLINLIDWNCKVVKYFIRRIYQCVNLYKSLNIFFKFEKEE